MHLVEDKKRTQRKTPEINGLIFITLSEYSLWCMKRLYEMIHSFA